MSLFTYHQDPGHGWIEVPLSLLEELGITEQISSCSYHSITGPKPVVYLEEDMDAGTFIEAAKAAGIDLDYKVEHTNTDHWIRNLPSWPEAQS